MIANINNNLPLDKAELIAFFLESLLYGVSALLFVVTLWVLFFHRKSERLNKRLVITSSLMMFFGTLHLAIDLSRILEGFITQRDAPGGPIGYFAKLFLWSHVFKTAIFATQTVLADSFATYRCYVVWNRIWAVVIPALSVAATLVTGIGVVYNCAILRDGDVFAVTLAAWITAFFTTTLATNVICTTLIAVRIWITTRKVARFSGQQTLLPVVIVVVESGAIYSVSCITLLTVYLLGSNAQYPALDGMFPIISIVFNLIIVRIALGIAHGGASGLQSTQPPTGIVDSRSYSAHPGHQSHQFPMKPLAVTVTQLVQKATDVEEQEDTPVKEHERGARDCDVESLTDVSATERMSNKERSAWNAV
ncbi:hypothetical protein JB92DRAFT_2833708 [Gautieria morchelliformis]|nr:hypothetical protein JB92DRAFT_2833708 [Gautieria morchelliformis]